MVKINEQDGSTAIAERRAELTQKLIALTARNGYEIIQTNGQRVYAPPSSKKVTQPPKGCEVFIGKIPKDIYEDELVPLFERIGPLHTFRIMLDFMERTRGYAFATYFNRLDADRAVAKFHNFPIRPYTRIGVYKSVDNCRLFLGNIPNNKTRLEVWEILDRFVVGIVDIIMYSDSKNPDLNRGFVFVEFETHRLAAMARRQFTPNNLIAWGQPLHVDWAEPLPDVDPTIMQTVQILYLRNLPPEYSSQDVYVAVCYIMDAQYVTKVRKIQHYAFVHFVDRAKAELAFHRLKGYQVDGFKISVEWARPRCYSKKYRLDNDPGNFCTSVPPNMRRLVYQRTSEMSLSGSSSNSSRGSNGTANARCGTRSSRNDSTSTNASSPERRVSMCDRAVSPAPLQQNKVAYLNTPTYVPRLNAVPFNNGLVYASPAPPPALGHLDSLRNIEFKMGFDYVYGLRYA